MHTHIKWQPSSSVPQENCKACQQQVYVPFSVQCFGQVQPCLRLSEAGSMGGVGHDVKERDLE